MSKVRLGCLCDTCLGKMLDAKKNKGNYQPYLANINVRWGSFDLENLSQMRFEENEAERYGIKKGDLIICEGGKPGRCAVWENEIPNMKIQKALHRVRPNETLDVYYLYYWFLLAGKNKLLERHFTKTTIKHLTGIQLNDLEIDFKDIKEQKRISSVLRSLDAKIRLNNKINETLQQQASLLYDYWFTQFDFPDENGKPYKSSGGKMVWNEQLKREIPEGWAVSSIAKHTDIYQPETISNSLFDETANYFVYGGGGLIGRYIEFNHNEPEVILSCRGNCGNVYYTMPKSWITGNAMVIHPKGNNLSKSYIYHFLNSYGVDKYVSGSVQKQLTRENLSLMPIIIPNRQQLNTFNEIVDIIFVKIENMTIENQQLTSLRDWLLPMLMNGQAAVSEEQKPIHHILENDTKTEQDHRFALWLQNQGIAARGDIDRQTLREIFDSMDDEDK